MTHATASPTDVVRGWARKRLAQRAAQELRDAEYVNLGIGLPTLIPGYLDPSIRVTLHSENGLLGTGSYPDRGRGGRKPH